MTSIKQRLNSGELLLGITATIGSPQIAELLASIGFDWIWIETEHTTMSLDSVQAQLQAISGTATQALVRVPCNDQTMIKRVLDIGPHGIIVPSVNNRVDAENAIRFIKYPPLGERGIGLSRAQGYGLKLGDYVKSANDEVAAVFMIEHVDAVKNIYDILAVNGLDAVIVGSLDLAGSMNLQNDLSNPAIENEIQKVVAACQKTGIPCGIFAGSADIAKTRIKQGFCLLTLGADVLLILSSAKNILDTVKNK
jgi:2-keto-3-deoxy-L-rhamnonate aldolase RhmA